VKQFSHVVALAISLAPAAALAQVQTYYHAGAWDAFSGRSETGGPVCGVSTNAANGSQHFSERFDIGGTDTALSASKPNWSIPDNTHVTVVMQIGLNVPWTIQATGHDHAISWTLDPNAIRTFDRQFRDASSMTLTFPDGNEPPWALSLAGSTAISDTFGRCVRDLTRQLQANPPPPNSAPTPQGATQPFGSAPAAAPDTPQPAH
jgi:hypothetical protein